MSIVCSVSSNKFEICLFGSSVIILIWMCAVACISIQCGVQCGKALHNTHSRILSRLDIRTRYLKSIKLSLFNAYVVYRSEI